MLFEEFAQSGEDWGASNMVASMRASREHTRRGEYRYMSRAESLINLFVVFVYMPIITQYVLFHSRYWWVNTLVSTLCIHAACRNSQGFAEEVRGRSSGEWNRAAERCLALYRS